MVEQSAEDVGADAPRGISTVEVMVTGSYSTIVNVRDMLAALNVFDGRFKCNAEFGAFVVYNLVHQATCEVRNG